MTYKEKPLKFGFATKGHNILACCRDPDKLFVSSTTTQALKLDFVEMNTDKDWLAHLKDIDVVINCVGIIVESRQ